MGPQHGRLLKDPYLSLAVVLTPALSDISISASKILTHQ